MIKVDGNPVKAFTFPGGEQQVKIPDFDLLRLAVEKFNGSGSPRIDVEAKLLNSDDIMQLMLTINAIRHTVKLAYIRLALHYLPYARQDRVCDVGEANGIQVMADIINSLKCDEVHIFDPHSDVAPALIEKCVVYDYTNMPLDPINKDDFVLVSPDAGAEKKVLKLAKAWDKEMVRAYKRRDVTTGAISNTIVTDDVKGKDCLVVDDICDGGATFVFLAEELRAKGACSLALYVTHGIFSKGLAELFQWYDAIYCFYAFDEEKARNTAPLGSNFTVLVKDE